MHEPYHLYEFGLQSFEEHSKKYGYELAFYKYYVCQTFMPKIADYVLKAYMQWTNSGMQLCVWLRKKQAFFVALINILNLNCFFNIGM
jgi:hypothetical protein